MTKEEILLTKPGRELDRLVVEVFGSPDWHMTIPHYSTDIFIAWGIVEYIKKHKLFSQRKLFMKLLQELISNDLELEKGTVVEFSDLLFYITPEFICKAYLIMSILSKEKTSEYLERKSSNDD